MREHGAQVEDYKGKRLLVGSRARCTTRRRMPARRRAQPVAPPADSDSFALAFLKPGSSPSAADRSSRARSICRAAATSVTSNDEVMNAGAVARQRQQRVGASAGSTRCARRRRLPENVASQIPAITWFSVSAHVNGGLHGTLRAETRDEEAANNLRDVVRGFLALGKMQAGAKPELQALMQSLELGGTGKTVALSFAVPAEVFDMIGACRATGRLPRHRDH